MIGERAPSLPRQIPKSGFEVLDNRYLLEEETFSWYSPDTFYPVTIGEYFSQNTKCLESWATDPFPRLGYVGICDHEYVTLKAFVSNHRQAMNEEKVYNHLRSINSDHPGVKGIRSLRDSFQLPGKDGLHELLVHNPLGLTLADIRLMSEDEKVSGQLLKPITKYLLMALDFLHTEAHVVHTDIQEGNIMLGIEDHTIFKDFEQEEISEPSLRKIDGEHVIYATRQVDIPDHPSHAVLCDFGDAQFGEETYTGEVMPDLYRAPEIVLGIPWNEKIDIWGVGLVVWDLFVGKHLFTERLPTRNASEPAHLARMIALLGPPPIELLNRGQNSKGFFDENGIFTKDVKVQQTSLEEEEENLEGEEKLEFLGFIRKMLQWLPEDRKSAEELMNDPWLQFQ